MDRTTTPMTMVLPTTIPEVATPSTLLPVETPNLRMARSKYVYFDVRRAGACIWNYHVFYSTGKADRHSLNILCHCCIECSADTARQRCLL